tara:strand:- start:9 stop:614 length:606 start_codon:yes stop_codon:yes gene_type:complete
MATHRDVSKISSYSCIHCDFEQIKVGADHKWIKLIDRLHKKKCKKTGRTQDRTSQDKIILMTTCSGKIGSKRQTINQKSGCGQEIKSTHELPRLYHQKLGTFKQKMTEKVQEQLREGAFDAILPKDKKFGKPRMIGIDASDGVAVLVGQQKITALHQPEKKRNVFVSTGETPGGRKTGTVVYDYPTATPDNISRKIMTNIK